VGGGGGGGAFPGAAPQPTTNTNDVNVFKRKRGVGTAYALRHTTGAHLVRLRHITHEAASLGRVHPPLHSL
jgi:hypothetical protein